MNEPLVMNITCRAGSESQWESGPVVGLEEIATYIENDSQIFLPIVPGETKRAYGLRLLKELAAEIRRMAPAEPVVRPHGYPGAGLGT